MIDFVKEWVVNIVALVLFIVLFEMLLPTGRMKKYVSLVTGVILIIAIISPIVELFGKDADISAFQISNSNYLDKLQIENDSKVLEKEQMKQIVDVYRDKIIEQLEQSAEEVKGVNQASADVIFNEDYSSGTFGEIKRVYIEILPEESIKEDKAGKVSSTVGSSVIDSHTGDSTVDDSTGNEGESTNTEVKSIKSVNKVEKVNVRNETSKKENSGKCDPEIKKRLEEKISGLFGISSDNIVITQVKR